MTANHRTLATDPYRLLGALIISVGGAVLWLAIASLVWWLVG